MYRAKRAGFRMSHTDGQCFALIFVMSYGGLLVAAALEEPSPRIVTKGLEHRIVEQGNAMLSMLEPSFVPEAINPKTRTSESPQHRTMKNSDSLQLLQRCDPTEHPDAELSRRFVLGTHVEVSAIVRASSRLLGLLGPARSYGGYGMVCAATRRSLRSRIGS